MPYRRILVVCTSIISSSAGLAGPCSLEVEHVQAKIDAYLEANADVGPRARESPIALLHHQPSADSIAAVEERLGELDTPIFEAFAYSMAIARASDLIGNKSACEPALEGAERAILLMRRPDESKTQDAPRRRKS
jgi:hypothetical protein